MRQEPVAAATAGVTVRPTASATAVGDPGSLSPYWRFHQAVAEAQFASWLPRESRLLVDISGPRARAAQIAAAAGHTVVRVAGIPLRPADHLDGVPEGLVPPAMTEPAPDGPAPDDDGRPDAGGHRDASDRPDGDGPLPLPRPPVSNGTRPGPVARVSCDPASLSFLADACVDGVVAEDRTLSMQLAAENLIADVARVLRPGGQVLACVDSLVLGMALLAEQRHWAELTDLPHAEVVLVPWPDGSITRCFGAEQLRELFEEAGLSVMWIRPRTVFSPSTVAHVLRRDPKGLRRLVEAELAIRPDESVGVQLVVSARKRTPRH
jgi:hypothetical protein